MESSSASGAAESIGGSLQSASVVAYLFNRAATANLESPFRQGAVDKLPRRGRLLMTGDLHDHTLNFHRILKLAGLGERADHHLILHELIHGPHLINGRDLSIRTLARAAQLKLQFPNQVHLLQANHELSQLGGAGISKNGVGVCEAFNAGIDYIYGEQAPLVRAAAERFIRSLLLAVHCDNGVFCSHSLPSSRKMPTFDPSVLERVPTEADLRSGGSGYEMVWGRFHPQELADKLGALWGAKVFLMGHQPADAGYEIQGTTMLVLASNHDHGVALPIDLKKPWDINQLVERLIPLSSVMV